MAGRRDKWRRVLVGLTSVAINRCVPRHPDKPLSYIPTVLNVLVRAAVVVVCVDVAAGTSGFPLVGMILLTVLIALPSWAVYAVGLVLVVRHRRQIMEIVEKAQT